MKTLSIYSYSELPEKAKKAAVENYGKIHAENIGYDWYEWIEEDAREIGVEIEEFDIGYGHIKIGFTQSAIDVANDVIDKHGETCASYDAAKDFIEARADILVNGPKKNDSGLIVVDEEVVGFLFKQKLGNYYFKLIKQYWDEMHSDEYVAMMLEDNEHIMFTEDGLHVPSELIKKD